MNLIMPFYNLIKSLNKIPMISLQIEPIEENEIRDVLKRLFQYAYANFLLILQQKSINFSPLPKQITPLSLTTSFIMYLPINETQMDVFCKIIMKWEANYKTFTISVVYKIRTIGGRKINEMNNRTKIQLISSISQINHYLQDSHSCLTIAYDQFDAFAFQARQTLVANSKKTVLKKCIVSILERAFVQFVKYVKELNEVDFLTATIKRKNNFQNLRQLLETLYISKAKLFINQTNKQQKSIKKCLALMLTNTHQHNSALHSLKQSNQKMINHFNFKENIIQTTQTIGNAIKIHKIKESSSAQSKRFYQNLQKNKAVSPDSQAITLKKITFQLRKSFGRLRQTSEQQVDYFIPEYNEDKTVFHEHVVFKRCIQSKPTEIPPSTQSTSSKSKEQMGHINEHNFLLANGNLYCPYIGKYYLNIKDSSISNITKRTIMTKMQQGDLFTQVAYNTYHHFIQFQLIQYLTIFEQLAKALCFLNQNKVLHRDIKPTNVLFKYLSPNNFICKLIDFGSCFIRRQQSAHMYNPKVFTTPRFNLTFKNALKLTNNQISKQFNQDSYQSHQLFDVYGIAETVSYLLCYSSPKYQSQSLDMIIKICKNADPNLRFTPQQLLTILQHLKLQVIAQSSLRLLYYQGSISCFQNN